MLEQKSLFAFRTQKHSATRAQRLATLVAHIQSALAIALARCACTSFFVGSCSWVWASFRPFDPSNVSSMSCIATHWMKSLRVIWVPVTVLYTTHRRLSNSCLWWCCKRHGLAVGGFQLSLSTFWPSDQRRQRQLSICYRTKQFQVSLFDSPK